MSPVSEEPSIAFSDSTRELSDLLHPNFQQVTSSRNTALGDGGPADPSEGIHGLGHLVRRAVVL